MSRSSSPRQQINKFRQEVAQALRDGYVALPSVSHTPLEPMAAAHGTPSPTSGGSSSIEAAFASSGGETTVDKVGAKDRGYINWGANNQLPNLVALYTSLLPYTAAGVKFNADVAHGLGPVPVYRYHHFSNQTVMTKEVDYRAAGMLIRSQIVELTRQQTAALREEDTTTAEAISLQIARLEEDYKEWRETNEFLEIFLRDNNLNTIFLKLFADMCHLGICFPELQLDAQRSEAVWRPRITHLRHRSALTCRLERMDDEGRIRHIYVSNRWLDHSSKDANDDFAIDALPALDPDAPAASLEEVVAQTRLGGKKESRRPTRVILPSAYNTMGRPYYPQPSWWTVFGGKIYSYASSIISDRVTRRENNNMWGKIVYIHALYRKELYDRAAATTDEERAKIDDKLNAQINEFLRDKRNNGKILHTDSLLTPDGREIDAVRIVDVPNVAQGEANANRTELEEVASIIFFALEIHPDLIGASPGSKSSSGGTYQREMYEMKKLLMAPTQQIVLGALRTMSDFNKLDRNLVWRIRSVSLTTLDRNKTGLEENNV